MNIIKNLFQSSIGKKFVMAITGSLLFGFVIVHLLGNLQIYLGRDALNAYAALLQGNKLVLWSFRFGLGGIALLHVTTAVALYLENRAARPMPYERYVAPYSNFSSRSMVLSGLTLFAFIVYHILHLTVGATQPGIMHFTDPKGRHDVYQMMVTGFAHPGVSGFYMLAMALLYFHLSHGIDSLFQSLGLKTRQYSGIILGFSQGAAILIFLGNCSIPVAILTGILK
jgi:succinate dehydrogenase / fumarate reductase cytochrome b subunit